MKITKRIIENYLSCKYKAHLTLHGESGTPHEYEKLMHRLKAEHKPKATEALLRFSKLESAPQIASLTLKDLRKGHPLILNCTVDHERFQFHFDALKRMDGTSPSLGQFHYVPVLFQHEETVREDVKMLMAFGADVIGQIQGKTPETGTFIFGQACKQTKVRLGSRTEKLSGLLLNLLHLSDGPTQTRFSLNNHCDVCEFRARCRSEATEKDDLSLLRGLREREIRRLNSKGIFTVAQYSYTFRPRKTKKRSIAAHCRKHDLSLQALAVRTDKIYVEQKPDLPSATTRLYLDVEGVSDRSLYYLIGLLACTEQTQNYVPLWADSEEHEAAIWRSFLSTIEALDDFVLYHYGSYDLQALKRLEKRHGGSPALLDKLYSSTVNVLAAIYAHVYFPTYSNGLKHVASYLGFEWSHNNASGIQALVWRKQWEEANDRKARQKLITYNHEDCLALRAVANLLERIGTDDESSGFVGTDEIVTESSLRFGKHEFFFPELNRINQCAYFDYQRSRVYVRTSPAVKRSLRRKERRDRSAVKINKEVRFDRPAHCPECGAVKPIINEHCSRLVYDLKVSNGGIKRWVVRYRAAKYFCTRCKTTCVPRTYRLATKSKFGPTLIAWSVYQIISLHNSYNSIAEQVDELFGFPLDRLMVARFKKNAADYYERTYDRLGETLRSGDLVHADESQVSIRGGTGYVWAFTNLEEVMYVYADSREGGIVQKILDGFKGVLISDFYSAYDSVACVQQKYLIHLIRDINNDLCKNPFDEELKQLGRAFTAVLVPIVETVDRYGLKRRHLSKHIPKVERFLDNVLSQDYRSDVAKCYKKRFEKYRRKLFRFLDYDGVPWNNNNAEQAVKRFALLRRAIGGSSTPDGIQRYLRLLSICETLRRKNVSVLQFLVSRTTDIDRFAERQRTRNTRHLSGVPRNEPFDLESGEELFRP